MERCTGCGSFKTIEQIRKEHPLALSCCPERKMAPFTLEDAVALVEEHEQSFNLRWAADMRAIKRWRAAGPGRDLTLPDHADLCVWLLEQDEWQPIDTAPRDTLKITGPTLILCHNEKRWIRFGKWYVQEGCWYYSGTSERSQYAQARGDEPTHWKPCPKLP
jgi:hypothetical protein